MTFLEAKKLLAELKSGPDLPFLLALSGNAGDLDLYLRAHAARMGFRAIPRYLPFGTLAQALFQSSGDGETELFLLLPWDLVPESDWRSGLSVASPDFARLLQSAEAITARLAERSRARFVYMPAPIPPLFAAQKDTERLSVELSALAVRLRARIVSVEYFSSASYLASGCPVGGGRMSALANDIIDVLLAPPTGTLKVLVTDADNTLWRGLVGDDGPDGVSADPHDQDYRHFIYQTLLKRLKASGVLLAVVSRNDEDLARAPLASGRMTVDTDDFVAIRAGYGAKSDHLRALADMLNLGLEAFVFVDDNPVELAEVAAALPRVTCLAFPEHEDDLPEFCGRLGRLFDRRALTAEDAQRTELYRRRMAGMPPAAGGDLREFLRGLDMRLTIRNCADGNYARAHQLINKTNQFNLNGIRLSEEELKTILRSGGRLYAATLEDRTGSHGEILACLIEATGRVCSLVMSCRVFQRRVEHTFLSWLSEAWKGPPLTFSFIPTERNEPMRRLLDDPAFAADGSVLRFDSETFVSAHESDRALFSVREEGS